MVAFVKSTPYKSEDSCMPHNYTNVAIGENVESNKHCGHVLTSVWLQILLTVKKIQTAEIFFTFWVQ